MGRLRGRRRIGTTLALFALALQAVLSFGHIHILAAHAASPLVAGVSASAAPSDPSPLPADQDDGDGCAICAVLAMAHALAGATPPSLPLPSLLPDTAPIGAIADLTPARTDAAFQARAPPAA